MTRLSLFCAVLVVLCGSGLSGCHGGARNEAPAKRPEPAMKAAPATPIAEKKVELGGKTWNPAWDEVVERALPGGLLSPTAARAVRGYCPRFAQESEADKRAFWAYLFQALAGAEAGLNPTVAVRHTEAAVHKMDSVSGRLVRQEGLLQLTYEDSDRYGCDFDWQHDKGLPEHSPERTILDPARNLQCGVKILENQIVNQHKPLVSRTSYFSTLQPGTRSFRVFNKQMANVPAACGVGELKPRARRHRR